MPRLQNPWNTRSHENPYARIGSQQHTSEIIKNVQDLSHTGEGYYDVGSGGVLCGHHEGKWPLWCYAPARVNRRHFSSAPDV